MALYTAQYRYSGGDRFDISVKGGQSAAFAPTWNMVMDWKASRLDEIARARYTVEYFHLLGTRHAQDPSAFDRLWTMSNNGDATLVCFCRSGDFCHRLLLAAWMEKYYGITYLGER